MALLAGILLPGAARAVGGEVIFPRGATIVPNQYIVKLVEENDPRQAAVVAERYGITIRDAYDAAFIGFSADMEMETARRLAGDPEVEFVEAVVEVDYEDVQVNPPNWGLDRIDQWQNVVDQEYMWPNNAAKVRAYVLDSGIRTTHNDFGIRASQAVDFVPNDGQGGKDCAGHGTKVAGILGGTKHGVAKAVSLISVRVGSCVAPTSAGIVSGANWVATNAIKPAVVNMSLSTPVNLAIDTAVKNVINKGIPVVAAAGNQNTDACTRSPAHVPEVISVGNTDSNDVRFSGVGGSNFGTCVDLFAPGVNTMTTTNVSDISTGTDSGTSMSAPHVTGVAAMYLSNHASATAAEVQSMIKAFAAPGVVVNAGAGSPNLLLSTAAVRTPSTFAKFTLLSTPYFLLYKPGTGAMTIVSVNAGGLGVTSVFSGLWTTGWTTIAPFLQNGEQRLLLYKAGTGQVKIEKINAGGLGTTTLWNGQWTPGWTTIAPFTQSGEVRLLFYKAGNGNAAIDKVNAGGLGTTALWSGQWSTGWTTVAPFTHEGLAKVLLYKTGNGKIMVDKIDPAGLGTVNMWNTNWTTGWTALIPYVHEGVQRLLCYKIGTGQIAVEKINPGPGQTTNVWNGMWSTGYTALPLFVQQNEVRMLEYKSGSGTVFIDRMNPGSQGTTNLWSGLWTTNWQ